MEAAGNIWRQKAVKELFGEEFFIKRPLLQALSNTRPRPPVLLIDELDPADEEFEGLLLELLADYRDHDSRARHLRAERRRLLSSRQIARASFTTHKKTMPVFMDRLPGFDKELGLVMARVPHAPCGWHSRLRVRAGAPNDRCPQAAGVSETLDWIAALMRSIGKSSTRDDRPARSDAVEEPGGHSGSAGRSHL